MLTQEDETIEQLRTYKRTLEDEIAAARDVQRSAVSSLGMHRSQLQSFASLLQKEKELLSARTKGLQQAVDLHQGLQDVHQGHQVLENNQSDLQQKTQQLAKENEELKAKVASPENQSTQFPKEKSALLQDMTRLQKQVQAQQQMTQGMKGDASSKQKLKLQMMLKEQDKKNRKTQFDLDHFQANLKRRPQAVPALLLQKRDLEQELAALNSHLQALKDQKAALEEQKLGKGNNKEENLQQMKEEVENIKLHHSVLADSLAAVRARFNSEELAVNEFNREEKAMRKYLSMLKAENQHLQEKSLNYMVSLDRLEAQKASLNTEPAVPSNSP